MQILKDIEGTKNEVDVEKIMAIIKEAEGDKDNTKKNEKSHKAED